jgi:hypothetical protein
MRWAAQCRQEAAEAQERQRAEFFVARRKKLEGKRFRDLLRAAPSALEVRSAEGRPGMGFSKFGKFRKGNQGSRKENQGSRKEKPATEFVTCFMSQENN